jgi:hypothetical protein
MDGWVVEWVDGWMNEGVNKWMGRRKDEEIRICGWMDRWTVDVWMFGWMDMWVREGNCGSSV